MRLTDPKTLRVAIATLGVVPAVTGLASMARGTALTPDAASADSEHRFYAAWWTALGPVLWSLAPQAERRTRELDAVAATLFAGGLARIAGSRHRGRPAARYEVLAALELVLPAALVLWPRAVRRRVLVRDDDAA